MRFRVELRSIAQELRPRIHEALHAEADDAIDAALRARAAIARKYDDPPGQWHVLAVNPTEPL